MIGQTQVQIEVWNRRRAGQTYDKIISEMSCITSHHMVATCLRRTSLGYVWYPQFKGGTDNYLCEQDLASLVEFLCDNSQDNNCLRTFEVQDAAHSLKLNRHQIAIKALISINCYNLACEIPTDIDPPSRSWINDFCLQHSFTLKTVVEIDRNRYNAGYKEDIKNWLSRISARVFHIPPELVFNADETMISGKRVYKGITYSERAISQERMSFAHMTAMITINAAGLKVPPYIILSGLMNLPSSLESFKSHAWFGSSANGWMTKKIFLAWCVNFANWMTHFRSQLPPDKAHLTALLYLDGHMTRLNPAGIDYLKKNNIMVIIFPSHISHIIQPFDVGCGSPLKSMFKKLLSQFTKKIKRGNSSFNDYMRLISVSAFLEAVDRTVTMWNMKAAFQKAGLVPFDSKKIDENPFVLEGRNPTPVGIRGYSCSGKILTDPEEFQEMYNSIIIRRSPEHITMRVVNPSEVETCLRNSSVIDGRQLTSFPSNLALMPFEHRVFQVIS